MTEPEPSPTGKPAVADTDELTADELARWGEWFCWCSVLLAPVIYWINGPSVSPDQRVVRWGTVIVFAAGALLLRWRNWRQARQSASHEPPPERHT